MGGNVNMENINKIKEKYSNSVIKNLNKENFYNIIAFLEENKCQFIEDIIEDYLDLFIFDYDEFVNKFNKLNEKYNNEFLRKASEDMNLLEEFYDA